MTKRFDYRSRFLDFHSLDGLLSRREGATPRPRNQSSGLRTKSTSEGKDGTFGVSLWEVNSPEEKKNKSPFNSVE